MKIGIITFHWATNYGAILQAYALQTYLTKYGHDVTIINYRPKKYKKTLLKCFLTLRIDRYLSNVEEYRKELKLEKFRKEYLKQTTEYGSAESLKKDSPVYDVYITGSDQVWNPYFTQFGEGKPTTSYFLDFGHEDIVRLGYAVSFGCTEYPELAAVIAREQIEKFKAISVRENSGCEIIETLNGFRPPVVLDPTLLLTKSSYDFNVPRQIVDSPYALVYMLRDESTSLSEITRLLPHLQIKTIGTSKSAESVETWVTNIRDASFVITNSFHGMAFSIIFNVPFIISLTGGPYKGMNDRFFSLLGKLGLENRIVTGSDLQALRFIIEEDIDWEAVNKSIAEYSKYSDSFFKINLA